MNKKNVVALMGLLFLCICLPTLAQSSVKKDNMRSSNFIFGKEVPWEVVGEGVSRQILGYDEELMMVRVKFEKGAVGALHHHTNRQCTYVLSGKFEFTIDGVKKVVSAGDCLFKTPDLIHGCVCLEAGELLDTFTPMRSDFIKDK